jgi:hypothetical protein
MKSSQLVATSLSINQESTPLHHLDKSVRAITSPEKWGEIDSESDLPAYQKLLEEGMFPWRK